MAKEKIRTINPTGETFTDADIIARRITDYKTTHNGDGKRRKVYATLTDGRVLVSTYHGWRVVTKKYAVMIAYDGPFGAPGLVKSVHDTYELAAAVVGKYGTFAKIEAL